LGCKGSIDEVNELSLLVSSSLVVDEPEQIKTLKA